MLKFVPRLLKHDFFELQNQDLNLKEAIKAISPAFFNLGDNQLSLGLLSKLKDMP